MGAKGITVRQVKQVYRDKEHTACPLTERLIKAGYQQKSGGYIKYAKENNMEVDYTNAQPTQYWHLFHSYFKVGTKNELKNDIKFTKRISCGELIFWMAEVLGCVDKKELEKLCNEIINNPLPSKSKKTNTNTRPVYSRRKWNKAIKDLCFDKIIEAVEKQCAETEQNS